MDGLHLIPAHEYRRVRWRNGRGWTREIHSHGDGHGDGGHWDWRLSIAEIEGGAGFSLFEGIDRELVLLEGEGLELAFDDGERHALLPPHQRLRFAGERPPQGAPMGGRATCFNLMWRREAVAAALWHRPLAGTMVVFVDPGETWALHLLGGRVRFEGAAPAVLASGDTVLLGAGTDRARHVLDGGGEALLVRLSPHAARAPDQASALPTQDQ